MIKWSEIIKRLACVCIWTKRLANVEFNISTHFFRFVAWMTIFKFVCWKGDFQASLQASPPWVAEFRIAMPCHAMPCHAMPCHAIPCQKKATLLYHTLPPPAMQPSHHPLITCWTFLLRWMSLTWHSSFEKNGFQCFSMLMRTTTNIVNGDDIKRRSPHVQVEGRAYPQLSVFSVSQNQSSPSCKPSLPPVNGRALDKGD